MTKTINLALYMKSGNKITVDKVVDWQAKYNDDITYFMLEQDPSCKTKLRVGSLMLEQIEAIVEH